MKSIAAFYRQSEAMRFCETHHVMARYKNLIIRKELDGKYHVYDMG